MRCGMDGDQLRNGDSGIDLRRAQALVAEHRLDVANIGSILEHVGCRCVAEEVTGTGLAQSRGRDMGRNLAGQFLR